jgi:catechol 2,3-dioxygenase-like lactoylglutathione lyase family enzyme
MEPTYDLDPDAEFYPMALFVQLSVADLDRSVGWYRDLGFDPVFSYGDTAHLRYARGADLMLVGRGAPDDPGSGVTIYVNATEPLDPVAETARERGTGVDGPTETGYNTRELRLRDPDGYELVFSEPVGTDRSFEDVMGGAVEESGTDGEAAGGEEGQGSGEK